MQSKTKNQGQKLLFKVICFLISSVCAFSMLQTAASAAGRSAEPSKYEDKLLYAGGMAFGVKFSTKGIFIGGITAVKSGGKDINPGELAGIKVGDSVISANGKALTDIKSLSSLIEASDGKPIELVISRNGKERTVTLTPVLSDSDGRYKAGLWLKDSTAGIGTVTYIDPETYEFGGLGHGIYDFETGKLLPLGRGAAMKVEIGGVVKGKAGKPGEIKGYFLPEKTGSVISNTLCGVFGVFASLPEELSEPIPMGLRNDVKEGKATLLCTLGDDGIKEYGIEISKIDRDGTDNKNFVVTVTDTALKERTGGIIQGMSVCYN